MEITFNDLPEAVAGLYKKISRIELLLTQKQQKRQPVDRWFDLPALCNYLPDKPARQTVYEWVSKGTIPHHKGGKKLRFLKSEIDGWLMTGRRKTVAELEAEPILKKRKEVQNG